MQALIDQIELIVLCNDHKSVLLILVVLVIVDLLTLLVWVRVDRIVQRLKNSLKLATTQILHLGDTIFKLVDLQRHLHESGSLAATDLINKLLHDPLVKDDSTECHNY